jgi:hypothetical protein
MPSTHSDEIMYSNRRLAAVYSLKSAAAQEGMTLGKGAHRQGGFFITTLAKQQGKDSNKDIPWAIAAGVEHNFPQKRIISISLAHQSRRGPARTHSSGLTTFLHFRGDVERGMTGWTTRTCRPSLLIHRYFLRPISTGGRVGYPTAWIRAAHDIDYPPKYHFMSARSRTCEVGRLERNMGLVRIAQHYTHANTIGTDPSLHRKKEGDSKILKCTLLTPSLLYRKRSVVTAK